MALSSLPVLSLPLSLDGFLCFPCVDEIETSQLPHLPSIMGSTPLESEAKITLFPSYVDFCQTILSQQQKIN